MPTLEVVSLKDAQLELSLTGKRGVMMRQYMDYINRLESGQAGKLIPDAGETTAAIRRRLGAAAQLLGKKPHRQPPRRGRLLLGRGQRLPPASARSAQEDQRRDFTIAGPPDLTKSRTFTLTFTLAL